MAMAVTGLQVIPGELDINKDGFLDPYEAAKYSVAKGYRVEGIGTAWGYFQALGKEIGLNVKQVAPSQYSEVLSSLKTGNVVVASMRPGHFTTGGHFILLTGVTAEGKILVNDSNSITKSNMAWDFTKIIVAEAAQFWIISK
jgi:hypothetical protein